MIKTPLHKVFMSPSALPLVQEVMYSGNITEGEAVKQFESALKVEFGTPVLTINSCTSAIDMALHLVGVERGDEVISTPMTCAATNVHVVLRGATLVWADISRDTGNILPESVASLVTDKTKAILVVDWGGRPVDCDEIRKLLPRPIPIIQDAAHSFMATYDDGKIAHGDSRSGDYVAWSFQAIKHLTTGDGGALKVPSHQFERARRIRWFGIDRDVKVKFRFLQDIPEAGYKYHMNDIVATIGLANLHGAVDCVSSHRANASKLFNLLAGLKTVKLPPPSSGSSWWFFSLRTPDWERFVEFAENKGIGAGPVHGRNDDYSGFTGRSGDLSGVDYYSKHHVGIPCGWWVGNTQYIADVVREWDSKL